MRKEDLGPFGWLLSPAGLLLVLAVLAAILAIAVWRSRIVVRMHYNGGDGENGRFDLDLKALGGLLRFRLSGPVLRIGPWRFNLKRDPRKGKPKGGVEGASPPDNGKPAVGAAWADKLNAALTALRGLSGWAARSVAKVRLTDWTWHTSVGTGEAVSTALATGAAWSTQTAVLGVTSQLVQLTDRPNMTVQPRFGGAEHFSTAWSCRMELRIGEAIAAGFGLLLRLRRMKGALAVLRKPQPQ